MHFGCAVFFNQNLYMLLRQLHPRHRYLPTLFFFLAENISHVNYNAKIATDETLDKTGPCLFTLFVFCGFRAALRSMKY